MVNESRTSKSIKNSIVALIFYFGNLGLQFYSRKIFLNYLGTEILGLNTTATTMIQFLNLAELGIGAAISFTLYDPLFKNDTRRINEIISLQGFLYRRIAFIIIIASMIIMSLFPWIFSKMALPLWYAYASFGVLLFSALLGYFVNYKQTLLTADQKDYKVQYSLQLSRIVKTCCQIVALSHFAQPYIWWLALEVAFAIIGSIAIEYTTKRTYPYLHTTLNRGKYLQGKHPEIALKIKQVFFHKIGSFALSQTSPIIIYAYTTLSVVALYGNYMLIISGCISLMNAIFNSITAGVGNLVAEGDKIKILSVFEELFGIRFIVLSTLCFGVYILTPDFISLWIGAEYLMDNFTLALMVITLYINLSRSTVDAFITAYGLYGDIWAPIVEASLNVSLSIILGYFWGLHGILIGILISLLLVIFLWKPYWLFKHGLKTPLSFYAKMYIKYIIYGTLVWGIAYCSYILLKQPSDGVLNFIINSLSSAGVFFCTISIVIVYRNRNIRNRICSIIHK